jgi:hypothetical protein
VPNHPASALVLVLAAGLLAACDPGDLNPLASDSRPPVSVAKEVTMVSAAELVGSWTCRELNPYPDQPPIDTKLDIRDDGTLSSEALLPMDQEMPGAGDLIMSAEHSRRSTQRFDAARYERQGQIPRELPSLRP